MTIRAARPVQTAPPKATLNRRRRRPAASLRHAPYRAEIEIFSDRRPHHPARGLCPVDQASQTDRGGPWMGQNRRRHGADRLLLRRTGAFPLHPDDGRQQPRPTAPAAGRMTMRSPLTSRYLLRRTTARRTQSVAAIKNRSGPQTSSAACQGPSRQMPPTRDLAPRTRAPVATRVNACRDTAPGA